MYPSTFNIQQKSGVRSMALHHHHRHNNNDDNNNNNNHDHHHHHHHGKHLDNLHCNLAIRSNTYMVDH
jgi:hypothetical protein